MKKIYFPAELAMPKFLANAGVNLFCATFAPKAFAIVVDVSLLKLSTIMTSTAE
jgi:hypothetical protein